MVGGWIALLYSFFVSTSEAAFQLKIQIKARPFLKVRVDPNKVRIAFFQWAYIVDTMCDNRSCYKATIMRGRITITSSIVCKVQA
jgi:hypothetical protein